MHWTCLSLADLDWETEPDIGPELGPEIGTGIRGKLHFSGSRTPMAELSVGLAGVKPGGKLCVHRHPPAKICHVADGEGLIRIGDVEHRLRPGMAAFIPPNAWHKTCAEGAQRLRFLFVFAAESLKDVRYGFAEDG